MQEDDPTYTCASKIMDFESGTLRGFASAAMASIVARPVAMSAGELEEIVFFIVDSRYK